MGEKPELKGFRPGRRQNEGGAARAEIVRSLPRGHPCRALQRPKRPGKTGRSAEETGCRIGKLSGREFRRSSPSERGQRAFPSGCSAPIAESFARDRSAQAEVPGGVQRGVPKTPLFCHVHRYNQTCPIHRPEVARDKRNSPTQGLAYQWFVLKRPGLRPSQKSPVPDRLRGERDGSKDLPKVSHCAPFCAILMPFVHDIFLT